MRKRDARKLDSKVQQELRYLAIDLFKQGVLQVKIAKTLGVSLSAITKWVKTYRIKGIKGLILKKRGIKLGTNCKLNLEQTEILRETLINKTPDQLGLNFNLWTRQAIQFAILKLTGVFVAIRTIGHYMKRLGFTPQKPIKRAYEQNPKAVDKWLRKDYPEISKTAKEENAEIHWLDETGLSSYSNYLRGYSLKGKTPIIRMKAKRLNLNIISSISKLGKMRFMTYKESLNTKILIKFVSRLCKDVNKKVFLILDNLAVHHSKQFMKWMIKSCHGRLRVFYLPAYSPELNPDERLNRDLKTHFHEGSLVKNEKELKNKVVSFLRKIQNVPFRIKNYFNSRTVKYAA